MVNFLPSIRLVLLILRHKFPSKDKPLQKQAPQKGPLKNISTGTYFRNFTVPIDDFFKKYLLPLV